MGDSIDVSCGESTPIDSAYYAAIASVPFVNVHFVCNYVWGGIATDVPLGRVYPIKLPSPLDKLHYVNATANAEFLATSHASRTVRSPLRRWFSRLILGAASTSSEVACASMYQPVRR
jgi:hypothetical protein